MDLFIYKQGDSVETKLSDVVPQAIFNDLSYDAPAINATWLNLEGSDGQRLQSVSYGANQVSVSIWLKNNNESQFRLAKSALQTLMYNRGLIRLRSSIEPNKVFWVLPNPVNITPLENSYDSVVTLLFTNPMGMSLSRYRSDEINQNLDNYDIGMNIPEPYPLYHYNSNNFNIYNPSDVAIDPYMQHHDMNIIVRGYSNSFTIKNLTNGTGFTCNSSLGGSDVFKMIKAQPSINDDESVSTDFGHIVLEKGNNNIQVSGLNNADITFSFPFLYF